MNTTTVPTETAAEVPNETAAERAAFLATALQLAVRGLNDGQGNLRDTGPPETVSTLTWLCSELLDAIDAIREGGPYAA